MDDGAEAAGGDDSLKTGDAGAHHEDSCRRDGAGGGNHHGVHLWQGLGGHERGLIARDGGHGRESVHRLGAADTRDQLQRKGGDALFRQLAGRLRRSQRIEQADHDLTAAQQRQVGAGGVRPMDVHEHVGRGEQRGPVRREPGALRLEGGIGIAGLCAPAPGSTSVVPIRPAINFGTIAGIRATRRSSGYVSAGTPTITSTPTC